MIGKKGVALADAAEVGPLPLRRCGTRSEEARSSHPAQENGHRTQVSERGAGCGDETLTGAVFAGCPVGSWSCGSGAWRGTSGS